MIPLSVPNISGNEWKYIKDCLDTNWVSSVGSYVNLFEQKMAEFQQHALQILEDFPQSEYKDALLLMVNYVIERKK